MKHLIITSAMVLAFFLGISKTKSLSVSAIDYVVTDKGIFAIEDARLALQGKLYMNAANENMSFKLSDITSVIVDGTEYSLKK
jgi:hypothetical protein